MIILIIGGSKSQKSSYGEYFASKLSNGENLYYLATMNPYDLEDLKRIDEHIKNRSKYNFKTIEQKRNLKDISNKFLNTDTILLDSITSLVTNEMFYEDKFIEKVEEKIIDEIIEISKKVKNLVIVSDYVFSDGILYDKYTEAFRSSIGKINIALVKLSDIVLESCYGNLIYHKGEELNFNDEVI